MTWILGSAIPFGYGALISDIRVTLRDGTHLDILQKIYPVGSMMMAGFAGSVEIGFVMIHDLQRWLHLDQPADFPERRNMWRPQEACWRWHRRGRRIFGAAPLALQRLGCQLLMVGAAPFDNGMGGPISRCVRMTSPNFFPERVVSSWSSIGTGAQHVSARHYAEDFFSENGFQYLKAETMNPGGAATATAISVSMSLRREPMATVSSLLQIGRVTGRDHFIEGHRMIPVDENWRPNEKLNVPLALSLPEFMQMCQRAGGDGSAAHT